MRKIVALLRRGFGVRTTGSAGVVIALISLSPFANSQQPEARRVEFQQCGALANNSVRLACFDNALQKLNGTPAGSNNVPSPSGPQLTTTVQRSSGTPTTFSVQSVISVRSVTPEPVTRQTVQSPSQETLLMAFGLNNIEEKLVINEDQALKEIESRIVNVHRTSLGIHVIELQNGQIWHENDPGSARISGDQNATIKRTYNDFQLTPEKGRSIRVHRVK